MPHCRMKTIIKIQLFLNIYQVTQNDGLCETLKADPWWY